MNAATTPNPTATPAPFPPIGRFESAYVVTRCDDDSFRFDVKGADGYSAPGWALVVLPLIGASIGFQVSKNPWAWFWISTLFAVLLVAARAIGLSGTQGKRSPAGTFYASKDGLRLPNGTTIPRSSISYLTSRNTMDGHVSDFVMGGRGIVAGINVMGASKNAKEASEITKISYQVEIESGGRATPVVGCLTESTARAVFDELKIILGLG